MEILLSNTKDVLKETLDDPQRHYIAKAGYFAIALGFIEYPSGTSVTNYLADETYFSVNFFLTLSMFVTQEIIQSTVIL